MKDFKSFSEILTKIQQTQSFILTKIDKMEENYNNLNNRMNKLENYIKNNNNEIKRMANNNANHSKKLNILQKRFNNGKYNEVLLEVIKDDKYLYYLLPSVNKVNFGLIDTTILNDIASRLCSKIYGLIIEEDKVYINNILMFFNQLVVKNINVKLVTKLNMKDSLEYILSDNKINLEKNEMALLDSTLKQL